MSSKLLSFRNVFITNPVHQSHQHRIKEVFATLKVTRHITQSRIRKDNKATSLFVFSRSGPNQTRISWQVESLAWLLYYRLYSISKVRSIRYQQSSHIFVQCKAPYSIWFSRKFLVSCLRSPLFLQLQFASLLANKQHAFWG